MGYVGLIHQREDRCRCAHHKKWHLGEENEGKCTFEGSNVLGCRCTRFISEKQQLQNMKNDKFWRNVGNHEDE